MPDTPSPDGAYGVFAQARDSLRTMATSTPVTSTGKPGNHSIQVRVTDRAGNSRTTGVSVTVIQDEQSPGLPLLVV